MELKKAEFQKVQGLIYKYCGINLHEGKEALVRARLMKRMRKLEIREFSSYLTFMEEDTSGAEFLSLVDVLTTNKTNFFRESKHFDFIRQEVIPAMGNRPVKWWSAGCSTGEEPVSWAITLLEEQRKWASNVKILATDLSRDVVHFAKEGVYSSKKMAEVPMPVKKKYFRTLQDGHQVREEVMDMITYGGLNLKKPWPLKGPFHMIMCRNVMIYFNQQTQQRLVSRFCDLLESGGYLFLGHSESVSTENKRFLNVRPAVYQKR